MTLVLEDLTDAVTPVGRPRRGWFKPRLALIGVADHLNQLLRRRKRATNILVHAQPIKKENPFAVIRDRFVKHRC